MDVYLIRSQTYKENLSQGIQGLNDIEKQFEDITTVNEEEAQSFDEGDESYITLPLDAHDILTLHRQKDEQLE